MRINRSLALGAVAGLAVAGAGAAIASTQFGDPKEESRAIINDAAEQLGVQPNELSNALKKALQNRIDAAVAAGRLSREEGEAIKQRIESGDFPLLFGGGFGDKRIHFGPFRGLDAAASYLGLTQSELRTKLQNGKSLADVAKEQDKSVDGLIQTLVDDVKKHLDEAVDADRLTQAQADEILQDVKQRITDFVNGNFPRRFGPGGPPGFDRDDMRGVGPGFPGPGGPPAFRGEMSGPGWGPSA